ncbi:hypothetical protein D623_10007137 [Myotis brandtii]|uniref:Uncharacterized protein n=1 Tax=Myotis brandtii TaxID=109478 RepID=S7NPQ0_MYOBR|nr:hypothetical protein D623_10007137 [Myotis brandtii]
MRGRGGASGGRGSGRRTTGGRQRATGRLLAHRFVHRANSLLIIEEGRERERQKHQLWERIIDLLPPACPLLGIEPPTWAWQATSAISQSTNPQPPTTVRASLTTHLRRAPKAPQEAKQALQSLPAIYQTLSASKLYSASIGTLRACSPNETFLVKRECSSPTSTPSPCPHSLNHSRVLKKHFSQDYFDYCSL